MPTRRTLLPLLACCLFSACSRKEGPVGESAASKSVEGWKIYQDEKIRVSHPEGWTVVHFKLPKAKKETWVVEPPDAMEDDTGSVMISEITPTARRPLEEFLKSEKMTSGRRFINPPKKMRLKIGSCLSYPLEYKYSKFFSATIASHCYRDNGNYLSIWSDIGKYTDNTKPDEDSLKNARIYERVLESLEFL